MKYWLLLLFSVLLVGCASTPVTSPADPLFRDQLFASPSEPINPVDVFALSAEMQHYLRGEIASQLREKGLQRGLFDALYSKGQLRLEYDSAMTRNAAQAFAAHSGNCLSLVIMTAAFAKELGLTVQYRRVYSDESWSRIGGLYFASGHVNLVLGRTHTDPRVLFDHPSEMVIDFYPPPENAVGVQQAWTIGEDAIVAMYMNNRAAELLADGQLDVAYWWARAAIVHNPRFLSSYNTLAVIYRRHGNLQEAEQVLNYALEREPGNTVVMSNLVLVLNDRGRSVEARALARKLQELEPYPPFYFFNRGLKAMREHDFKAAKTFFAKEVDRDAYYHEFHYWLAAAYLGLGEVRQAREQLAMALENSTSRTEHDLYAAKLDRIGAYRAH